MVQIVNLPAFACTQGLAGEDERMAGWSNHLDGAKALIRLRGENVIKESSPEGLEMFQLVRSMLVSDQVGEPKF